MKPVFDNDAFLSLKKIFALLGDDVSSANINRAGQQTNFQFVEPIEIQIDSCFEIVFHTRDKLFPKYELQELRWPDVL